MEGAELIGINEIPVANDTEHYENNYHYGWETVELNSIQLVGGVRASEIGLPPEIKTTEIPDGKWCAELMVYYKDHLTIAKQDPKKWFEGSLYLREQVVLSVLGAEPHEYDNKKYLFDEDDQTPWRHRSKEVGFLNPDYVHEQISVLREQHADLDKSYNDDDEFLLACVNKKYEELKHNDSEEKKNLLLIDAKRTSLIPHGVLTIDDWFSPIFEKGYMPASLFASQRLNAYDITVDRDLGAWQKLQEDMGDYTKKNGLDENTLVSFPPNLTNGYLAKLPYLDHERNIKYVEVYAFDQIDRVPPKIFRDNADPESVPQNRIILARDKDGSLKSVKPDLGNTLVIKEKQQFSSRNMSLEQFFQISSPINENVDLNV